MSSGQLNPPLLLTICDDEGCRVAMDFRNDEAAGHKPSHASSSSGTIQTMLKNVGRRLSQPFGIYHRSRSPSDPATSGLRFFFSFEEPIVTNCGWNREYNGVHSGRAGCEIVQWCSYRHSGLVRPTQQGRVQVVFFFFRDGFWYVGLQWDLFVKNRFVARSGFLDFFLRFC